MEEEKKEKTENPEQEVKLTAEEAVRRISCGKLLLSVPITDGDKQYEFLEYDFNALTGWELAKALDGGGSNAVRTNSISDVQSLSLFAAAAAKRTGGLDATDIRTRLSAVDAIAAINVASLFFRGSLLAANSRITSV